MENAAEKSYFCGFTLVQVPRYHSSATISYRSINRRASGGQRTDLTAKTPHKALICHSSLSYSHQPTKIHNNSTPDKYNTDYCLVILSSTLQIYLAEWFALDRILSLCLPETRLTK